MKTRRFDWVAMLVTFATVLVLSEIMFLCYRFVANTDLPIRLIYSGFATLLIGLGGFAAFTILNNVRKQYVVRAPKLLSGVSILLLAALFVLGAVGETLYSLRITNYQVKTGEKVETEVVEVTRNSDIIILIDHSGSMSKTLRVTIDACEEFINQLPDECRLGYGAFSSTVSKIELRNMDSDGKRKIISDLNSTSARGGTDFDAALEAAWDEFEYASSPDRSRFIVMFTDGVGSVDTRTGSIGKEIIDSNIKVFSVRINGNTSTNTTIGFVRFIKSTGGTDSTIKVSSGYTDDDRTMQRSINQIVEQLDNMVEGTEERRVVTPIYENHSKTDFVRGFIFYDNANSPDALQITVRAVFFVILAILMQLLYFRKLRLISVLANIGIAVVVAAAATFAGILGVAFLSALPVAAGFGTLYSSNDLRQDNDFSQQKH